MQCHLEPAAKEQVYADVCGSPFWFYYAMKMPGYNTWAPLLSKPQALQNVSKMSTNLWSFEYEMWLLFM